MGIPGAEVGSRLEERISNHGHTQARGVNGIVDDCYELESEKQTGR
jgi:hypothetical protein